MRRSAEKLLDEIVDRMALALGEHLYSTRGETLEEVVGRILTENRATIAVAESCTGGLLAERLTNVPGSSIYFLGGVVCYSNDLKTRLVDVPAEMIEAKGAVSPEVAMALAEGIRKRTGATLGIGVTGIAGPGGGTPEKPVGLVYIGIADERGPRQKEFRFRRRPRPHPPVRFAIRARYGAALFSVPFLRAELTRAAFRRARSAGSGAAGVPGTDRATQKRAVRMRAGCARKGCTSR